MISEEKQALIRKRLVQGIPAKDIAVEAQVSLSTIKRVKAKAPMQAYNVDRDTGDNSIKLDYSMSLTKSEEKYTKKLQGMLNLYEDEEEGWCYHLAKTDYRFRTSGNWWTFIAYPESVPEGWIQKLQAQGFEISISPLHDKDPWNHDSPEMINEVTGEIIPKGALYKMGDRKKAHWHGILKSDKRMSYMEANNLIRSITNGPYIQKCRSLKLAYEYFLHKNNPEKYQGYDKDEIIKLNGFHIEPNKYEAGLLQCEILNTIRDYNMTKMEHLIDYYRDQPEYITLLTAKPGIFTSLINAQWKSQNPNGRTQRVIIVKEEEE